jgi:hypothetical protein
VFITKIKGTKEVSYSTLSVTRTYSGMQAVAGKKFWPDTKGKEEGTKTLGCFRGRQLKKRCVCERAHIFVLGYLTT